MSKCNGSIDAFNIKEKLKTEKEQLEFFRDSLLLLSYKENELARMPEKYGQYKSAEEILSKNMEKFEKEYITLKECKEIVDGLKSGKFLSSVKNEKIECLSKKLVQMLENEKTYLYGYIKLGSEQGLNYPCDLTMGFGGQVEDFVRCLCELINEVDRYLLSIKVGNVAEYIEGKTKVDDAERNFNLALQDVGEKLETRKQDHSRAIENKNSLEVYKSLGRYFFDSENVQGE